jgi:hypothetical protein
MKTSHSAHRMLRNPVFPLCLALVLVVVAEFMLGDSLVPRSEHATASQPDELQAPNVSLGEVLSAIR